VKAPKAFLIDAFHDGAFRNCRIHYWIEPQDLHLTRTASGDFEDTIQFVAIVYRDDGLVANSISYTSHVQIPGDQIEDTQANGLTFDQTIAIPASAIHITSDLFLRAGVNELSTNHIGAIELPTEWITAASTTPAP
jgi:hypothetical protein